MLLVGDTGATDENHRHCNVSQLTEPYHINLFRMHFVTCGV